MLTDEQGMRALSIRQPYAELILRGIKTADLRSRPTRVVGERFLIYVCKARATTAAAAAAGAVVWSADLRAGSPPDFDELSRVAWMIELAEQVRMIEPGTVLPTGVILRQAQDRQRRHRRRLPRRRPPLPLAPDRRRASEDAPQADEPSAAGVVSAVLRHERYETRSVFRRPSLLPL